MTNSFQCIEHTVPCQHIRHYAKATSQTQEDELQLAVKQYKAQYASPSTPGDVTIIASHASGFPKEVYEPLFEALYQYTKETQSWRIRSIWIADVANNAASGVLNEEKLGNTQSYYDNARDLLLMVNHFRKEMPRPIVGFGHSMGANVMINLSLLHPRLLTTIIAVEPIAMKTALGMPWGAVLPLTLRKDVYSSREEATKYFLASPFFKHLRPDVVKLWTQHALRPCPTYLHPSAPQGSVTLATTTHQEALNYARPALPPRNQPLSSFKPNRIQHPELFGQVEGFENHDPKSGWYKPETTMTFANLPFVRPSVFYMYGGKSHFIMSQAEARKAKLERTGTGVGGSGGAKEGRVIEKVYKEGGHYIPLERPDVLVPDISKWLSKELDRWRDEESNVWADVDHRKRSQVDEDWLFWIKEVYAPKKSKGKNEKANKESKL